MQNIDYFARCSISSIQGYERDFTHTCHMNFFFILCHVNSRSIKNDKCHTFYVVCRPLFVFCSFSWTKASLTNWSKTVFDFHFLSAKSISRWSSKKKKEKKIDVVYWCHKIPITTANINSRQVTSHLPASVFIHAPSDTRWSS